MTAIMATNTNTNTNTKVVVTLNGQRYDLTDFYRSHPGGSSFIESKNGRDITKLPKFHYQSDVFQKVLRDCLIVKQSEEEL